MERSSDNLRIRAEQYLVKRGATLVERLGFGLDGTVYATNDQLAIKVFYYERLYAREREVYQRLQKGNIRQILRFEVPQLKGYDDALWIVEMTIVQRPFVLDFASAYLDRKPEYPEDVLLEWEEEKLEQFGERWPEVCQVIGRFAGMGIYLADVKPGNIEFSADDKSS